MINHRTEYIGLNPGIFVKLCKDGSIIMSDMPMELHTNSEFVQKAHGDVFIAGLGIGLIVLAIQDKEDVRSITIVEKYQEVIDLVFPYLPLKKSCKVICEDIFDYIPDKKYNTIYFDIWNDITYDIQEIDILGGRFTSYLDALDPERYIGFWREQDAIENSLY